jgi:hypothetical protein
MDVALIPVAPVGNPSKVPRLDVLVNVYVPKVGLNAVAVGPVTPEIPLSPNSP